MLNQVTPNEIACKLEITGLQLRNWLRDKWRSGDARFADHRINDRWSFSPELAAQLEQEYRHERIGRRRGPGGSALSERTAASSPDDREAARLVAPPNTPSAAHRTVIRIGSEQVETLADLLGPVLLAVVVGINPAPTSVAAGHYWQGRTGATLWRRLRRVGLLPGNHDGFEDDAAFAAGVGFTDVVKRPTRRAEDVTSNELAAGRDQLEAKLVELEVPLVIFAFKKAATTLLGDFVGNGFIDDRELGSSRIFVMPGPYEASATADRTLATLAAWVHAARAA
jgi:TDG/mug DNA glycosylase family protein